ncbi:adhesion G protein-coupled receptor E1-like [Acropora muricata]|uniref:adhesion G protein-coupled receptor E1-like n=1 Tax=Acropora muricata TaxID=159855 RepID=UPI0034E45A98
MDVFRSTLSFDDVNKCPVKYIDECTESHICGPHANCTNQPSTYVCSCAEGYESKDKNKFKCTDIDECMSQTHKCDPNSYCSNTIGSYGCKCKEGFKMNMDECMEPNICGPHTMCTNHPATYKCSCLQGFESKNKKKLHCTDIDECITRSNCNPNSYCSNTIGSFGCTCKEGFKMSDEGNCEDIDECEKRDTCGGEAKCENTDGSYKCNCREGYKYNAERRDCFVFNYMTEPKKEHLLPQKCEMQARTERYGVEAAEKARYRYHHFPWEQRPYIDECTTKTYKCNPNSYCSNTIGSYGCTCKEGFKMSKKGICKASPVFLAGMPLQCDLITAVP